MRRTISLILCAALAGLSLGPGAIEALAGETLVEGQGRMPVVLPVIKVDAPIAGLVNPGLDRFPALPAVNVYAGDIQAVDAATLLAPVPSAISGIELPLPAADMKAAPQVPGLDAAVEATAEDARNDAVTARAQLDGVRLIQREDRSAPTSDGSNEKAAQDRVWTGARESSSADAVAPTVTSPARNRGFLRRAVAGLAASVLIPSVAFAAGTGGSAAPSALPHWLSTFVSHYGPYLSVGAAIAVIFGVNKVVQRVIGSAADRAGWEPNTKILVQRAAAVGVWGLGTVIGMHVGGAPAPVLKAVAGLGGTAVTMASKQILGNAFEASKVLLYHSFMVGDRIKIGSDIFKVTDLSLRYVTVQNEAYKSSPTNFTYLQLAGKPLTILRPYEPFHKLPSMHPGVSAGTITRVAGKTIGSAKRKTWLWLAGGLAVAIGSSFVMPLTPIAVLVTALTYLKAASIMVVAHNTRSFILDFIQKLSEKAGWNPQSTLVAKLIAEVLSYTIGGSWSLRALGTTWMMVMGSLGATGLAFTLVTSDILSNLVSAAWLMSDRNKNKSFRIGDYITTSGLVGKVVDMNFQYVVLDHGDGTHSLISYALLKDSEFTILSSEDLPAAKAKYAPAATTPPQGTK
jgi:small-conductance mechanosensitive channel